MRRPLAIAATAAILAACAVEPTGPSAPIAPEQFPGAPALDASAARQTVVDFVDAYAASPTEGVGALANLVGSTELVTWAHWLDVQHREFGGDIQAGADVRDVEFIEALEVRRATGARVGLSASVTFRFAPDGDDAFERARILDGPVTLLRTDAGTYRVFDLLRDGVPMSDGIEIFDDEVRDDAGVTVTLDSLFMFPPNWQFNVVVANASTEPILLDPNGVGLFVRVGDAFERVDGALTGSLAAIPPGGQVEGILAFPTQDTAEGRVLSLAYAAGRATAVLEFPLDDLVNAVPPPPPPEETPVADVTT
jgi:hypothetical protein